MTYGGLFETGTMAGLIMLFRRHSRFMTNFRIFKVESRSIGSRGRYVECEEPRCAEGLAEARSAWVDAETAVSGTGWALAIPM